MGRIRVGPQAIREYLGRMRERYGHAARPTKGQLLDEVCGHCQLVEGSALLPREIDAPDCSQQAHVTASHSTNARVRSRRW